MTAGRRVQGVTSQHWNTPHVYVAAVREVLGEIELDPCSNPTSVVNASREYLLPQDGLVEPWDASTIFVNPPYGRDSHRGTSIKQWLIRCRETHQNRGSEILALVPVATNTSHWKENIWGVATAVAFLYDTRLKFLENGKEGGRGAPMACAMVYWGGRFPIFRRVFSRFGAVVGEC